MYIERVKSELILDSILVACNLLPIIAVPHQGNVIDEKGEVEVRVRSDVPGDDSDPAGLLVISDVVHGQKDPDLSGPVSAVARCQDPGGGDECPPTELVCAGQREE